MKTVKDACEPHELALDFALGDQVEDLRSAIGDAPAGEAFFKKNYLTAGQRLLLEMGLKRLDGRDKQAVFELTQAMGGGKTHTMVAFGLLARYPSLRKAVVADIAGRTTFKEARVVSFSGRNYPEHFVWGDIAEQLGKGDEFSKFWKNGPSAPDEQAWMKLLGEEPILILLDELPPYLDVAVTKPVGGGTLAQVATAALANLFSAALKLPRVCIVMSNLSGSYDKASGELHKVIRNLEGEARRQSKPITPVELGGDEIYQILKKRLFKTLPPIGEIEKVADGYAKAITEAERSKAIAKSSEQIAHEIRQSYPFHPAIRDVIALFRNNESYRQTRGLMQFVSRMIQSVWQRKDNDIHLIGLQHLNLNSPDVREELTRIRDLRGAIASDIAADGSAHAEVIDAQMSSDACSQVATLLLTASLSTAVDAVKGLTKQRLLEFLVAPMRTALEFTDAFEHLKEAAWYLHKDRSEAYYFAPTENLKKRLDSEAERAPQNKIDLELRRRLEEIFEPKRRNAYQQLYALPRIDEVKTNGPRVLLILSPDSANPPEEGKKFYETITEKNNVCILTGDSSNIANLEDSTRMIWAIAKVQNELPESDPKQSELGEKMESAELDFNSTVTSSFNRIWYPLKDGLTAAKLSMTFEQNEFDGEEQVERALTAVGVSKLRLDWEKDPTDLIARAETMLWPANQKRVPWKEIKRRALENPRWAWMPNNGIELLRKAAEERGTWRSTADGYIEKGPFEQPKTEVVLSETSYDEDSGEATLEVTARAGSAARVYWSTKPQPTPDSGTQLKEKTLKTRAVRLWFLAVDPSGKHETGPAQPWTNKLTIKHEPRDSGGGKRLVELRVVPAGMVRYTLTGANAAEGTVYSGPVEIGAEEATIYCHADADGVTAKKSFFIPRAGNQDVQVDQVKPAKLKHRVDRTGTADSYELLARARQAKVRLSSVTLEIGQGEKTAVVRFGAGTAVTAEQLEDAIKALRAALDDETADVRVSAKQFHFGSGHDLSAFVADLGIKLTQTEVEQS